MKKVAHAHPLFPGAGVAPFLVGRAAAPATLPIFRPFTVIRFLIRLPYGSHGALPLSPGPGGLRPLPEDGIRLLPGVPGPVQGLHRSLPLL